MTDNMKRRGGTCDHPACEGDPDGCRQWSEESMAPTADDLAFVRPLVEAGWRAISTKYRTIALPPPGRSAEDLLKPEMLETREGKEIAEMIGWRQESWAVRYGEKMTLTFHQFRAFKQIAKQRRRGATIDPDAAAPPPAPPERP